MTEELITSEQEESNEYKQKTKEASELIDYLYDELKGGYNDELVEFNMNDIGYTIVDDKAVLVKISEVLDKDEEGKFYFRMFPYGYKIGIITKIKLYLERNHGFKFKYPFPWENFPSKGIPGVNLFRTSVEAHCFLILTILYYYMNISFIYTKEIKKLRNGETSNKEINQKLYKSVDDIQRNFNYESE